MMDKDTAPIFVNVPREHIKIKEEQGMTWAGVIKLGIDSIERNKQYSKMVELIGKQAQEIERLQKMIRNGSALDSREFAT